MKKPTIKPNEPLIKPKSQSDSNIKATKELRESLREVKMMRAGKIPKKTWKEVRDEI